MYSSPSMPLMRPGRLLLSAALMGIFGTQCSFAAGLALIEQSVSGMGTAYAGAAATADTVDTLYFNPAGMTRLPGTQGGAAVHLVLPQTKFRNEGTTFSPAVGGGPIAGGNGGDAGGLAAVPHAYLTHQLDNDTWLGLAINVPFGLTTEYDSDWVGRYHAIKSAVQTININPSAAYSVNDQLSVAAGVSAMYLDGEFTNAVDFGLVGIGAAQRGNFDGTSKIEGDSWGWGYNLGLLYEFSDATRIGLHYRSEVEQGIQGKARFSLPPALSGGLEAAGFVTQSVKSTVDLPASFSASAFHQLNPEWAVMADYTWTGWSSIPELRFDFDDTIGLPDGVTTFNWKDTNRISVGATLSPKGDEWTYRLGVAYDESPIKDAASRSARLPDADRLWLTVGAGFKASERLSIDVGYAHIFVDDPVIRKTGLEAEDVTRGALRGSYDSSVDILSIEARYAF